MRMRRLGNGQSVVFCVPTEIRTKIIHVTGNTQDSEITISDILAWVMSETNVDLRRTIPIWATQGRCFVRQKKLWEEAQADDGLCMDQNSAEKFLEDEAKSIATRYRPVSSTSSTALSQDTDEMLHKIAERCKEFESTDIRSRTLQEEQEQERELAPEVEEEREVERPPPAEAAPHNIHDNVRGFVATGKIPANGAGFIWAFEALRHTSAAECLDLSKAPRNIRVTADFARTIKHKQSAQGYDSFQRSVQFVLTSTDHRGKVDNVVVISPYEANELLASIQESRSVMLHLYAPRQNQGFALLDHLQLFTVPAKESKRMIESRFIIELNVFAGQLYFKDFQEYIEVCNYLGLA